MSSVSILSEKFFHDEAKAFDHVEKILVPEPCRQVSKLHRSRQTAANTHAHAFDTVLVPVHPRHRFAPDLGQPIETVGTKRGSGIELVVDRVHAECVIRACEHDALHAVTTRAFVQLVQPAQIVFDDFGQRALDARSGEMDADVDTFEDAIHDGRVTQIAKADVFAFDQRCQRLRAAGRAKVDPPTQELGS